MVMRSNLTNHDSYECEYAKYDCGFCNAVVEGKTAFVRHVFDMHGSNIVKFSVKEKATKRPRHAQYSSGSNTAEVVVNRIDVGMFDLLTNVDVGDVDVGYVAAGYVDGLY